jgi:fatty acid desaturase
MTSATAQGPNLQNPTATARQEQQQRQAGELRPQVGAALAIAAGLALATAVLKPILGPAAFNIAAFATLSFVVRAIFEAAR